MKKSHVFNPEHVGVLEMEERKLWQNPDQILGFVDLKPSFVAADLGCGSGFFTLPLAKRVAKVYAIDMQKEMLQILEEKLREQKIKNVKPILSKENQIPLNEESVDFLISVNTLHEFSDRQRMIREMHKVLKPDGKLTIVDFKKEKTGFGPPVSIRVSWERAVTLFERKGFQTVKSLDLPFHYALVFSK